MLEKVKAFIEDCHLIDSGDYLIVACSGGSDSVALLHVLVKLAAAYPFTLAVAHVNHGLRGEDANHDEAYVKELSARLGVPCYCHHCDVQAFAKEHGLATEEAGRIVRYRFFHQLAFGHSQTKIVTAHHQDDQAETVLMNLLRGSGSAGLKGIRPKTGSVIRPLLAVTKQEIVDYLAEQNIVFCYDKTNSDIKILRNRIRLCLLPQLELEYNNRIKASLCRTAAILQDEQDFIEQSAQSLFEKVAKISGKGLFLSLTVQKAHPALIRAVFRLAIEKKQGHLKGIRFYHVEELTKMLLDWPVSSQMPLPRGLMVYKNYDNMEFTYEVRNLACGLYQPRTLQIPGVTMIPELKLFITAKILGQPPSQDSVIEAWFDYEQLVQPLFVRSRHPGDKIQPKGFVGSKKVKNLFIDEKVPQEQRPFIPVVYNAQGIVWLGGLRQSSLAPVASHTKIYLQLSLGYQEE
ncbi:tRNA(Ile)-lysidine synthase [Sporomusaceae bacterium BoRhaA]|uniref:tRNA lysidine(34) synthetase TilS n=1 Tax=Pelorhabdus rhamnosifermentans TaxID=2772457 RepID=UPI001C0633A1|nr:tRNA lysidine(34) synthetase TilS [Pelorhabdus rhamnosifermentans]MBU2700672.1 tRNA(Ile)-lysidine synthase [Pelorhabdus rhamnosifermentans]